MARGWDGVRDGLQQDTEELSGVMGVVYTWIGVVVI